MYKIEILIYSSSYLMSFYHGYIRIYTLILYILRLKLERSFASQGEVIPGGLSQVPTWLFTIIHGSEFVSYLHPTPV